MTALEAYATCALVLIGKFGLDRSIEICRDRDFTRVILRTEFVEIAILQRYITPYVRSSGCFNKPFFSCVVIILLIVLPGIISINTIVLIVLLQEHK